MYIQRPRYQAIWAALGAAALDWAQSEYQDRRNASHAAGNRHWQEHMSNTSYQRAAKDLHMAGLNRVLALGQGAVTPSGAVSSMDRPNSVQAGIMASSAKQQIALQKAEEKLVDQKESESESAEALNKVAAVTSATQAQLNTSNAASAIANARLLEEQTKKTADEAAKVRAETSRIDMWNPLREGVNDLLKYLDGKLRNSAKDGDGWWPKLREGAKDYFRDDPDSGWYDNLRKDARRRRGDRGN